MVALGKPCWGERLCAVGEQWFQILGIVTVLVRVREREREGDLSHVTDSSRSTVSSGWTSVLGLGLGRRCSFSLMAIGQHDSLLFQGGKILFFLIKTFY